MRKLLSANFARLWKSKTFWFLLTSLFALCLTLSLDKIWQVRSLLAAGYARAIDKRLFSEAPYIGAFQAVFISFFLGTEYSDGTIRNKLVVGHQRGHIFLSNFVVCLAASYVFLAAWWVSMIPYVTALGMPEMGAGGMALYALAAVGFTAVFTALYTAMASSCSNKALTVILTLVVWLGLIIAGSGLYNRLDELEFHGGMAYIDGAFVEMEPTPNPLYLTGTVRTVCEFLRDLLPTGQAILMNNADLTNPLLCTALSVVLCVCVTAAGAAAFRRKDIK